MLAIEVYVAKCDFMMDLWLHSPQMLWGVLRLVGRDARGSSLVM